ncbi:hypothetical protein P7K49_001572 [Saguinus oedipus]|uniref:Uncharacterized protein n=1 Tax=Saguinus oedipus TaxID=9490 RepID=A0ABQ9WFX4_SAGOE|nr:hypothetical protein P7K49_001572 [Saguinus oedipus]
MEPRLEELGSGGVVDGLRTAVERQPEAGASALCHGTEHGFAGRWTSFEQSPSVLPPDPSLDLAAYEKLNPTKSADSSLNCSPRQSGLIGCMSFGVKSLLTPDKRAIVRQPKSSQEALSLVSAVEDTDRSLGAQSTPGPAPEEEGQEISGWYYLLGEHLGRTKHLKVATRRLQLLRDPLLRMPGGGDTENGEKLKVGGDN